MQAPLSLELGTFQGGPGGLLMDAGAALFEGSQAWGLN